MKRDIDCMDEQVYFGRLLDAIIQNTDRVPIHNMTKDICAGFRYALSTLEPKESEYLYLRYWEEKERIEICDDLEIPATQIKAFEENVIRKLRAPGRWNYILYGVAGYLNVAKRDSEICGFRRGYAEGYKDGAYDTEHQIVPNSGLEEILDKPIEMLGVSVRALHCLQFYKCVRIADVAKIPDTTIRVMRGLGAVTADEVARALQDHGIVHTAWEAFIL